MLQNELASLIGIYEKIGEQQGQWNDLQMEALSIQAKTHEKLWLIQERLRLSGKYTTNWVQGLGKTLQATTNLTRSVLSFANTLNQIPLQLNNIRKQFEELDMAHANFLDTWRLKLMSTQDQLQNQFMSYQDALHKQAMSELDYRKAILDIELQYHSALKKGAEANKAYVKELEQLYQPWVKLNDMAAQYTRNIGGSHESMEKLASTTLEIANTRGLQEKYNISSEELIKLQMEFNEELGRAVKLTGDEYENVAALNKVFGDKKAIEFVNRLSNFGYNVNKASGVAGKLFSDASKYGISASKLSKNFLDNMKMAQNLTFRRGVSDLAKMAEKATELNFNMQQTASAVDKLSTLEGAMEASAQLSVLGGNFASYANPLAMLNEAINDTEGLQERIINQFSDLAKWDSTKGEISMDGTDRLRMQTAAKAMGLNPSDITDMIFTKARQDKLRPEIDRLGVSDDVKRLISNVAQLDSNGRGMLNLNGEQMGLNEAAERFSPNELERMLRAQNNSDSENISEIAQSVMSIKDVVEGYGKMLDDTQAELIDKNDEYGKGFENVVKGLMANKAQMQRDATGILSNGKKIADINKKRAELDAEYAIEDKKWKLEAAARDKLKTKLAEQAAYRDLMIGIPMQIKQLELQMEQAIRQDKMYDISKRSIEIQKYSYYAQLADNVIQMAILGSSGWVGAGAAAALTVGALATGFGKEMWNGYKVATGDKHAGKNDEQYKEMRNLIEELKRNTKANQDATNESRKQYAKEQDINNKNYHGEYTVGKQVVSGNTVSKNLDSINNRQNYSGIIGINGPKHSMGGITANFEGGESIINARSTAEYWPVLDEVNRGVFPKSAINARGEGGYNQMTVNRGNSTIAASNTVGFSKGETVNVVHSGNVGGVITINLEGNTRDIDTNEFLNTLVDNPIFQMTLSKALRDSTHQLGTFGKDMEYQTLYQQS